MPCNTAHFWLTELRQGCPVPFLSIVEASCQEAATRATLRAAVGAPASGVVGLIGTQATLAARLFDTELLRHSLTAIVPNELEMQNWVLPAIDCVKSGEVLKGGPLIERAVQALLDRGAHQVVLACTETPLALDAIQSRLREHCIDTNSALARACVSWWLQHAERLKD